MNEEYFNLLYARAKEVQPNISKLVQDFKASGMTQEEILLEISVALIHEGYRLRDFKDGIILKPHKRKLQAHVGMPEKQNKERVSLI